MELNAFENMELNPLEEKPLYLQIEDGIKGLIASGELVPGDTVPSSSNLAVKLSVSELTARKSIRNLVNSNVLYARKGRGTFVAAEAAVGKVLWVCGVDIFKGDVSPYFTDMLRFAQEECTQKGLTLEPVWLSTACPEDSDKYCNLESCRRYAGYIFIACNTNHRLLKYVQKNKYPHVHVTHEEPRPYRVTQDFCQSAQLGVDYLASRDHKRILVICSPSFIPILKAVSVSAHVEVQFVEFPWQESTARIENHGYYIMHQLLAGNDVPTGLFIMDDIVARGVTRAILQDRSCDLDEFDIIVRSGQQEMVSYGIPTAWIVNDTGEQAREAVRILHDQVHSLGTHPNFYVGKFDVIPPAGIDSGIEDGSIAKPEIGMVNQLI